MKRSLYRELVRVLTLPFCAWPHLELLSKRYGVALATLRSISSQEAQARVIRTHHLLKQAAPLLTQRWLGGADALDLAAAEDFPPCLVMRQLLKHLPLTLSKQARSTVQHETLRRAVQRVGEVLRDPSTLHRLSWAEGAPAAATAGSLAAFLERLEADVRACVAADGVYSPLCDLRRRTAGVEHEARLYGDLEAAGLPFWSEEQLRAQGFFKTPDARLQVPIAVRGQLVNWIDSKASFGDDRTHTASQADQFQKYINRYGAGMVLYWNGFIEELAVAAPAAGLLLADAFPVDADILTLPRLPLDL